MKNIHDFEPLWGVWKIEEKLGSGSYGTVWKASRVEFGKTYLAAIKHISVPQREEEIDELYAEGIVTDEQTAADYYKGLINSLIAEINTMYSLRGHTYIVSYEDHLVVPKEDMPGYDLFIRMELLHSIMQKQMSEQETIKLGMDIAEALTVLEKQKLIHRDIKPQNIFVNDMGEFKLGDFGTARQLEKTATMMSKKGTLTYMAPEINKGDTADKTVDIYSLGLVMYRLLNKNRIPFLPLDTQVNPDDLDHAWCRRISGEQLPPPVDASPEMAQIILKACAYRPKDRYQNGEELKKALAALRVEDSAESDTTTSSTNAVGQDTSDTLNNPDQPKTPTPNGNPCKDDSSAEPGEEGTIGIFGDRDDYSTENQEDDPTVPSDDYLKHVKEQKEKEEKEKEERETGPDESGSLPNNPEQSGDGTTPSSNQQGKPTKKIIGVTLIVLAVLGVLIFVIMQNQKYQRDIRTLRYSLSHNTATNTPRPTNTPTPRPTNTPTPRPTNTPTPKPTEIPRTFEISPYVSTNKGRVTVTWTDSLNAAPYLVSYEYYDPSSDAVQAHFLDGKDESSSTVYQKQYTFDCLIPGKQYWIYVDDATGMIHGQVIRIPSASTFVDGRLKDTSISVSIEYRKKANGSTQKVNSLSASAIENGLSSGTTNYGLYYRINIPQLAKARSFFTQIVFYAPNGYAQCVACSDLDYPSYNGGGYRYWNFLGDYFFDRMYDYNDYIPRGTYKVELYWDGMIVNTSTFRVD